MTQIHRASFPVHSFDVDAFGCLTSGSLAGFLQEAAAESASNLGFGLSELNSKGLTWVLVREHFELDSPIRIGDLITIETWPSGVTRRAALRDFRLIKDECEVGRALTSWLVLDVRTRRPVRPQDVLPASIAPETPHVLPVSGEPIARVESVLVEQKFDVRFSDIDVNLHVTNASYVDWIAEAIDEQTWRNQWLKGLDIQFLLECSLGSQVFSRSAPEGPAILHSIVREHDGKELARARSTWGLR